VSPPPYNEDTLVQQTTADYLEEQLGWESVYAYNSEIFVPNPHPQPLFPGEEGSGGNESSPSGRGYR